MLFVSIVECTMQSCESDLTDLKAQSDSTAKRVFNTEVLTYLTYKCFVSEVRPS